MSIRVEIINRCIKACNGTSYLEIGCKVDGTFKQIQATRKVGVDIASGGTIRMSSDEYFATYNDKFDVIFIDGCHHHNFVMRDFLNALKVLNQPGFILMHDCNPITRDHESSDGCWTSWRAFVHIKTRDDINTITCNFDHGLSIVHRGVNCERITDALKSMDELNYDDLEINRSKWLNPQPYDRIIKFIDGLFA